MTPYRTYLGVTLGLMVAVLSSSLAAAAGSPAAALPPEISALDFRAGIQALLVTLGGAALLMAFIFSTARRGTASRVAVAIFAASAGLAMIHYPALAQVATTPEGNVLGTTGGSTVVTLPYGEYIAGIQAGLTTLLTVIATALLAWLPLPIRWAVNLYGVDKLVKDAVGFAVAATPGASRDAKLQVDVGSKVLARALQKAIDDGAPRLIKAAGGIEGLQEKILAQMNLHPDVTAKEVAAATPATPALKS